MCRVCVERGEKKLGVWTEQQIEWLKKAQKLSEKYQGTKKQERLEAEIKRRQKALEEAWRKKLKGWERLMYPEKG